MMCARVQEVTIILERLSPHPIIWDRDSPLIETRSSPYVTIPNLVTLGQTVRALEKGPKIGGRWAVSLRKGASLIPPHICTFVTMVNLVVLGQTTGAYSKGHHMEKFATVTSRFAFQGHSKSLEPARIDRYGYL